MEQYRAVEDTEEQKDKCRLGRGEAAGEGRKRHHQMLGILTNYKSELRFG